MFFDFAATRGSHHTRPGIEKRVVCGLFLVFAGLVGSLLVGSAQAAPAITLGAGVSNPPAPAFTTAINPTQKAIADTAALVPVATFARACNRF